MEIISEGDESMGVAILLNDRKQKIPFQAEMEYGMEFSVEDLSPKGFRCTPSVENGIITSDTRIIVHCIPNVPSEKN